MLKKKKLQHSSHSKLHNDKKNVPLSRLEEIAQLQRQLISIIGQKKIEIDSQGDLFERLQNIYINHLQRQLLGREVLQKIIWLVGEADVPIKIKMIYFLAHEYYLQGENPIPLLQEGFQISLHLKHKVSSGYRCGLVLAQLSQCSRMVESTLNVLVVSLEEQIGFRPFGLRNLSKTDSKSSSGQLKTIYIGRTSHKSKSKFNVDCNKLQRIDLSKCLYEAYLVGSLRLQSEAKRRYYLDCLDELGRRLIRENPGINIKQKLQSIDQGETTVKQFQQKIVGMSGLMLKTKKEVFSKTDPHQAWPNQSRVGHTKTYSEVIPQQKTQSCQVSPLHFSRNTNSSQNRYSNFKIQLKQNKINRPNTVKSSSSRKKTLRSFKDLNENTKENCSIPIQQKGQTNIVLKFDKLQRRTHEGKPQIRKRKIKRESQHWAQSKNPVIVGNVMNLSIIPSVRQQNKEEFACQTTSKELTLFNDPKPIESNDVIESLMCIGDENENGKIDNLLKEGVEWIDKVINKEDDKNAQNTEVKEEIRSEKSSNLSLPNNNAGLKDSLKIIPKDLDIANSGSQVIIGTDRSDLGDISCTELCKVRSRNSQQIKESISDSQSIEYKIVINNFQSQQKELKKESPPCSQSSMNESKIVCHVLIVEEVSKWLQEVKDEVIDVISNKKIKDSIGVRFDEDVLVQAFEEIPEKEQKQDEYSYHRISGNNEAVRFKKVETIKTEQQSCSFSIEEGLLNFTIKDQTVEDIKINDKAQRNSLTEAYVTSMFEDIVNEVIPTSKNYSNQSNKGSSDFSHLSSQQSQTSLSGTKKHPRSSISDRLFEDEDINAQFDPIQECVNSQRDSDIQSSDNSGSETPHTPNTKAACRKERSSNFTCSRFAGSKIEQTSVNCVSNLNIIEELIKTIQNSQGRISDRQMVHGETLDAGVRSRAHSEKSSKSNKNNLSELRDTLHHVQISMQTHIDEKSKDTIFKFEHWLSPILTISPEKIHLKISIQSLEKEACREQIVPEILKNQLDKLTHIQEEILWFLDKFPKEETSWQRILEEFTKILLLPEKIEITSVLVQRENSDQLFNVHFQYSTSNHELIAKAIEANLKTYPISLTLNGDIPSLIQKLTPKNIILKQKTLILSTIWTVIGKRNIKLRDKFQNDALDCTFEVFECYLPSQNAFFYQVNDTKGESMSFGNISEELRKKVIGNIDMIIGFAIKLANRKISFTPQNINNLIKLL